MDIQFDQCENPRRTLTCAKARRSTKTLETSGVAMRGPFPDREPEIQCAKPAGRAPGPTLGVELTSAATIDGPTRRDVLFRATGDQGRHQGWFRHRHGSVYDTSGRIRQGPPRLNLAVPEYALTIDAKVKIG
jgi:hypothetical protein